MYFESTHASQIISDTMKSHGLAKLFFVTSVLSLSACGGGSGSNTSVPTTTTPTWVAGQFEPESQYAAKCEVPRVGIDPFTGAAYEDEQGSALEEKLFLRSWTNNSYLWYDEVEDNDPNNYTVASYFDQLKTDALTPSGTPKDNFHFSQSTADYNALAQTGVSSGYGFDWEFVSAVPPRELIVRFTEPDSPAANAGIPRGAKLIAIDGVDFVNNNTQAGVDIINNGLFPSENGQITSMEFELLDGSELAINLTSSDIQVSPVQNVAVIDSDTGRIGYFQFNRFIRTAQADLIDAFNLFVDESVSELVIDLRYNGGGLLALASQVSYMVAGSNQTNGMIFETLQFNDKHPTTNPVTGDPINPTPFYDLEIDYDAGVFLNSLLPSPELTRVYVITSGSTCSASESVMNALRGIDVEVVQIGTTTCGKPYGFYPTDNCGETYFSIQFQGINQKGFGDYADGFTPTASPVFDYELPGCVVADDFTAPLGDPNEGMLAAALEHITSGTCPVTVNVTPAQPLASASSDELLSISQPTELSQNIFLHNKILQPSIKQPD